MEAYEASPSNIIAVYEVPTSETHQYGILGVGAKGKGGLMPVVSMVEKPPRGTARKLPNNFSMTRRLSSARKTAGGS